MMNFASMKFFLVGLTLTAMLSACSDDETSDLIPEPSISISALESEIGALNFSINVENAEQCAYVCMNANESLPTTADEIFATGTSIKLTDKNKLSIRVPVDKQITYAVIAAAANQTGKTISNKLQLTPLKDEDPGTEDPEPKPEQIDITFSTGELLYLPNGMLLINLFETDNTNVYQTQIKLEGIENNGA